MRYTGPKNKLARRFSVDLGLKTTPSTKLSRRLNIPPGQHGQKRRSRKTSFGEQLTEKQKLKLTYGLTERQLKRAFDTATKSKGATGKTLLTLLERRLDNVVYRLSFTPTRASARQLVSHGHVQVNGKRLNIPSYQTTTADTVSLDNKGISIPSIASSLKNESPKIPPWLERKGAVGQIAHLPQREEIDTLADEQLIVEFYSR